MNLAPGVDITLLSSNFTVSKSAVGVPQSIGTDRLLPPKVSRVLLTSSFCGRTLQTILAYATSFHLSAGISHLSMNLIVSVPVFLPGMPWASRPTSFPNEYPQSVLNFGCLIKCRYSSNSPVSVSITDPAKSHIKERGYRLLAACCGLGQLPEISTAASRAARLELLVTLKFGASSSMTWGPSGGGCVMFGCFVDRKSSSPRTGSFSSVWMSCALASSSSDVAFALAAFFILARWSSILVGSPSYPLRISTSKSMALLVALLITCLPFNTSMRSSVARNIASDWVTTGWVMYLCLKKTVWPTLVLLVSFTHIEWHR